MGDKKKSGSTGALRTKSLFTGQKSPFTVYTNGLYSHQDKQNYQNQQNHLTVTRTKWEEIKRGTKRQNFKRAVGIQQGRMNSGKMVNSGSGRKQFRNMLRNFAGCEISQPAKFCRLGNFRNLAKFLRCSNLLVFSALLSFWSLIYNVEFDSNSLCLNRLNNFGKSSLQKLQN